MRNNTKRAARDLCLIKATGIMDFRVQDLFLVHSMYHINNNKEKEVVIIRAIFLE